MTPLSPTVYNTNLWQSTLANHPDDLYSAERERLRSTFLSFRDRVDKLADEIRKDIPDLTVHDLTHLDALWEIGATIVGQNYILTPTEAFVLGGAILLHDLAMSVAATQGGYNKIKEDPRWADLVTFEYQSAHERKPTSAELSDPEPKIKKKSLFNLLRQIHAENAEKLAFLSFPSSDHTPIFLIEDTEIRQTFGRAIGQIAHSHWWSITEVEKTFSRVIGAPHWCPTDWTVDPLKLACILRAADASHLDARRAPTFLKAISKLSPSSEEHWTFQEKLNKPYLGEDALVFTAGHAFRLNEAAAWWLCLDTLRVADSELRSVDALFAEKGYLRFAARRVAGVDTPDRLSSYVHTDGWYPINAMVHVTDLPGIIHSIGGKELYGQRPEVALRELVQNSCDAIRARRMYEKRSAEFGKITVSISEPIPNEHWLEVKDTGIGMSQRVLTDFLLDFGRSFWGSPQMQEELPGLLSSGIKPIGKYGIGFFSVFMIAEHVTVATRRSDMAARDTQVLEFSSGLEGRPILRPADKQEQLLDGGTHVKLKLKKPPYGIGGLLSPNNKGELGSLPELCCHIFPAIDADLYILEDGLEKKIISASDWKHIAGPELLARMPSLGHIDAPKEDVEIHRKRAADNLLPLINEDGDIVGRALITLGYSLISKMQFGLAGVVTVGGMRACSLTGICGVLTGNPTKASRDSALPNVSDLALKNWAEAQADIISNLWSEKDQQAACAEYIWMCGGNTKHLPICKHKGRWLSYEEIQPISELHDVVLLVDNFSIEYELQHLRSYDLDENVFVTSTGSSPTILQSSGRLDWPKKMTPSLIDFPMFRGNLCGAVVQSIAQSWGVSVQSIASNNELNRNKKLKVGTGGGRDLFLHAMRVSRPK